MFRLFPISLSTAKHLQGYEVRYKFINVFCDEYVCLSSYGQTGTGKTFTMEGEKSSEGGSWDKVCYYNC